LVTVANAVGSVDLGGWTGDAAQAYMESSGELRTKILVAGSALSSAATALRAHGDTLEWAQAQARSAVRLYDISDVCVGPGPLGVPVVPVGQAQAMAKLSQARAEVYASGNAAAWAVEAAANDAPIGPGVWNWVGYQWSELWHGGAEAFGGLGQLAWDHSTVRLVVDPDGWLKSNADLASGLVAASKDPVQLGKDVVDYDTWTTSPARAVGHLAPDALIAALTAGSGVALTRGASAGAKLATGTADAGEDLAVAAGRSAATEAAAVTAAAAPQAVQAGGVAASKIAMFTDLAERPGMPTFLKPMFEGSRFNWENYDRYTFREVVLDKLGPEGAVDRQFRLDSYTPGQAVVSRKFTQLSNITPETARAYISEAVAKYQPGRADLLVAHSPANLTQFDQLDGMVGSPLRGKLVLEVPVQTAPIPPSVLHYAAEQGVMIRDVAGTIYRATGPGVAAP